MRFLFIFEGFGITELNGYGSSYLRQVDLHVYPFSMCNSTVYMQSNAESQLCVGDLVQNKDTCLGDSGN